MDSPAAEPLPPSAEVAPSPLSFPRLRLLLVLVFALNSLSGRKVVQSVNSQFEHLSAAYYSEPAAARDGPRSENKTEEVAIVITSSFIPSHPSTHMIDTVLNSTKHLVGLSPTAPIFITVDHFPLTHFQGLPPAMKENVERLEQYTINLFNQHLTNPRVHVIPGVRHEHVGGSVMKAMNLISIHYPSVRYLYYLQHDYCFITDIDHAALIDAMDARPDKINLVRFLKRDPWGYSRKCGEETSIQYNRTLPHNIPRSHGRPAGNETAEESGGPSAAGPPPYILYPTSDYSDNNHLARFQWYRKTIAALKFLARFPEDPLQGWANGACANNRSMGLYLYQERSIRHLDGRHSAGAP